MTTRRDFLLGCAAAPVAGAQPYMRQCGEGRLAFRILRYGRAIGSHTLDFVPLDDGFDVRTAFNMEVGFRPIRLFRYHLTGTERWRGGSLVSAESATNHDRKKVTFSCRREGDGLSVTGSQTLRYRAPGDALPARHWNKAELDVPWISFEDGRLLHPKVEPGGSTDCGTLTVLSAERLIFFGQCDPRPWYEPNGRCAALASRV
jgi:hypothetical protein